MTGATVDERMIQAMMTPGCDLPDVSALYDRPGWHAKAACRGLGTEGFIFEARAPTKRLSKLARAMCASCEVQRECLRAALDDPELVGTWGGTSQEERKAMRRQSA